MSSFCQKLTGVKMQKCDNLIEKKLISKQVTNDFGKPLRLLHAGGF